MVPVPEHRFDFAIWRSLAYDGTGKLKEEVAIPGFRKQTRSERAALAEKLRAAREETGLSQRDVAQALGVGQSLVSGLENGQRRLDVVELKALAVLYDKPPAWFLE